MRRVVLFAMILATCCVSLANARGPSQQGISVGASKSPVAVQPKKSNLEPSGEASRSRFELQTIAIFVAILIFAGREALELSRRHSSRRRRLQAVKAILARACELNHWTTKSLSRILKQIQSSMDEVPKPEFTISFRLSGRSVVGTRENGELVSQSVLPETYPEDLKARLLDIAELDEQLLPLLDDAIMALAEVQHVKDSLISHIKKEDEFFKDDPEWIFEGFLEWGIEEIDAAYESMSKLYEACTGNKLVEHRLR